MISMAARATPDHRELSGGHRKRTRLLVVDDHAAVRTGLRQLLDDEEDFKVVAAVSGAETAMSVAEKEPIDVAVVDYQLGGRNGLWVSRKLKRLGSPPAVVMYSAYTDGVLAAAAVVAEADGIVGKGSSGSALQSAIRKVARGHRVLGPMPVWLTEALRRRFDPEEQAIFGLLLAGVATPEIAATLDLSAAGLESRLGAMLRRLEAAQPSPPAERPNAPYAA